MKPRIDMHISGEEEQVGFFVPVRDSASCWHLDTGPQHPGPEALLRLLPRASDSAEMGGKSPCSRDESWARETQNQRSQGSGPRPSCPRPLLRHASGSPAFLLSGSQTTLPPTPPRAMATLQASGQVPQSLLQVCLPREGWGLVSFIPHPFAAQGRNLVLTLPISLLHTHLWPFLRGRSVTLPPFISPVL